MKPEKEKALREKFADNIDLLKFTGADHVQLFKVEDYHIKTIEEELIEAKIEAYKEAIKEFLVQEKMHKMGAYDEGYVERINQLINQLKEGKE